MAAALASRFSRGGRSFLGGLSNAFSGLMNSSNGVLLSQLQQQQQQRTFIQMRTILKAVDNSGAKEVMCIQSLKGGKRGARLGDIIVASVKDNIPMKNSKVVGTSGKDTNVKRKAKKGNVVYGVVVRSAMPKNRVDGSQIKFDDNAVVIVGVKEKKGKKNSDGSTKKKMEYNQPIGTRVFGPVPHEMRLRKQLKILTLAQHIV